jgi:hypothetical protein
MAGRCLLFRYHYLMVRARVALLVAVCTAATLLAGAVHGRVIVLLVACASLSAGLAAYAESAKKNACEVTQRSLFLYAV